jgi:hypothetical protein
MSGISTINGSNSVVNSSSSSNQQRSTFRLPETRRDNNGNMPIAITGISLWIASQSETRQVNLVVNNALTENFFPVISTSATEESGILPIFAVVDDSETAQTVSFGHNTNGAVFFGTRPLSGTNITPLTNGTGRSYVGKFTYAEVPSKPLNFTVHSPTDHSVTLRWEKPETDGGVPIKKYVIQYSKNQFGRTGANGGGQQELEDFIEVETKSTNIVVDSLDSDTQYWFRILAANRIYNGESVSRGSEWTAPLNVKTSKPIPYWTSLSASNLGESFIDTSGGDTNGYLILDTAKPVLGSSFYADVFAQDAEYYDIVNGSLPPGLSIDNLNGIVKGIPETVGEYSFTISAANELGSANKDFVLQVTEFANQNSTLNPEIRVGSYYVANIAVANATGYSLISSTLPVGLELDILRGRIYGVPQFTGDNTFTIRTFLSVSPTTVDREFSILVKPNITIFKDIGGVVGQTDGYVGKKWDGSDWVDFEETKRFDGADWVDLSYPVRQIQAIGGTIVEYNDGGLRYRSHIFSASGTFEVISLGESSDTVSFLSVAGGGSGGAGSSLGSGAGGGGGGLVYGTSVISPGVYNVIVGNGALASFINSRGSKGENSSVFGVSSIGGGGGARGGSSVTLDKAGQNGGSGGGAAGNGTPGAGTGSGSSIQGYLGGNGSGSSDGSGSSGGGGGASQVGANGSSTIPGSGGNGKPFNLSGSYLSYGGGGGAGSVSIDNPGASGGSGGGANGQNYDSVTNTAPSGSNGLGGGGGGARAITNSLGGPGGSGIVIIRYPIGFSAFTALTATGGTTFDIDDQGIIYRVHQFSSIGSGEFSVLGLSDDPNANILEYLIVGGGASGGAADNEYEAGAGGGAGGVVSGTIEISSPENFTILIGSGGTSVGSPTVCPPGNNGGISSFFVVTATGGGGGGSGQGRSGKSGGSGGGAVWRGGSVGTGISGQGNTGSKITSNNGQGGAGGSSGNPIAATQVRVASLGRTSGITGLITEYARGGNGGVRTSSSGGAATTSGGGGGGGRASGEAAGNPNQRMGPSSPGLPGIVIVRYKV